MRFLKWANGEGFTIVVDEVERMLLIRLLQEVTTSIEVDGFTYELEIEKDKG